MATDTLDIATTIVPRGLVQDTIPRLLAMLVLGPYSRLRWVAHLDCPEALRAGYDAECEVIESLRCLFDESAVMYSPTQHGCNGSFRELFQHVKNDMLLVEDDKYATRDVNLADVAALDTYYFNWGRRATRTGGFECSWWRQDVVRDAVAALPLCLGVRCLENELKVHLKGKYPKVRRNRDRFPRDTFVDIGVARLAEMGVAQSKDAGKTPAYSAGA